MLKFLKKNHIWNRCILLECLDQRVSKQGDWDPEIGQNHKENLSAWVGKRRSFGWRNVIFFTFFLAKCQEVQLIIKMTGKSLKLLSNCLHSNSVNFSQLIEMKALKTTMSHAYLGWKCRQHCSLVSKLVVSTSWYALQLNQ